MLRKGDMHLLPHDGKGLESARASHLARRIDSKGIPAASQRDAFFAHFLQVPHLMTGADGFATCFAMALERMKEQNRWQKVMYHTNFVRQRDTSMRCTYVWRQ